MNEVDYKNAVILKLMEEIQACKVEGFNLISFDEFVSKDPTMGYGLGFKIDGIASLSLYIYQWDTKIESSEQLLQSHIQSLRDIKTAYPAADFGDGEVDTSRSVIDSEIEFFLNKVEYEVHGHGVVSYLLTTAAFSFYCKTRITHPEGEDIDLPSIIQRLSHLISQAMNRLEKKVA